jgi:predicted HNH restriction endonuclease
LDITDESVISELCDKFLSPVAQIPKARRSDEFLQLTKINSPIVLPTIEVFPSDVSDTEFIEGKRKRVQHLRVERSPLLRKYYKEQNQTPVCRMCQMNMANKFPWTDYMLDIHHLLPLTSSVSITNKGTSLNDIVGLCPSCHRSIHIYYTKWLKLA